MKVWVITGFAGHWPVGTSAVVVAEDAVQAAEMLKADLKSQQLGYDITPEQFEELDADKAETYVLNNGDY